MRKFFGVILTFTLIASLLGGCRGGNVSDREDGKITDPTNASTTTATMPSTDTAPIATTEPVVTTIPAASSDPTTNSESASSTESASTATEEGSTEGNGGTNQKSRQARPKTSSKMN